MNGSLYYVTGDNFNARQDIWDLKSRVVAEDRHRGYMTAIRLLFDLAVDGFKLDQMDGLFNPTDIEDILLFEDCGVRLAFFIPNDGRLSTPDIMLLAAQFCPRRGQFQESTTRAEFVAIALDRREKGYRATWPLVKPQ